MCVVRLDGWGLQPVEWFERILRATFPASNFKRTRSPQNTGLLGVEKSLEIVGASPAGGVNEIEALLSLLNATLTIEDGLEESHALAYHKNETEDGGLVRSRAGSVLYSAKYNGNSKAAEAIENALARFVQLHPRYRSAKFIAAVPPHARETAQSLCRTLVARLATRLGMAPVAIQRVDTRTPQKNITDENRKKGVDLRIQNQEGSMRVAAQLSGGRIIVIDDLYGSGGSMREAARALRHAGASVVLGLVVTKQRLFEGVRMTSQD